MRYYTLQIMTKHKTDILRLLQEHALCDSCLGRLMKHHLPQPMANRERGEILRSKYTETPNSSFEQCFLCEGLCDEISHFADLVADELQEYEYSTFLIGCVVDDDILQKEHALWESYNIENPESIKTEIHREIGKLLEPRLQKTVVFEHPDIHVIIDTRFDVLTLQIKPVYLYGRYQKLQRDIPQTTWHCRICRGVGCRVCNFTGQQYPLSVEEAIGEWAVKLTNAKEAILHGAGREDIDALMVGEGRPFVLEIKHPHLRTIDLHQLEQHVNKDFDKKVQVHKLRWSTKEEIARLKQASFRKIYRITIEGKTPFIKEKLKEVAQILPGTTIQQFTPTRVAHRRAQKNRSRTIYQCTVESIAKTSAVLTLETESGTYVKEFVSGDEGRTQPNLSELLDIPCTVTQLDVIDVKGE